MNPFYNLAAAAGGAAANYAINRAANYLAPQQPAPVATYNMQPLAQALPPLRGRGGGRRGRGRGRGGRGRGGRGRARVPRGISTQSGATITVQDTEILGATTGALQKFSFNPAVEEMVRLKAHEKMYQRYRISYFNITYVSGSAMNVAGNVAMGIIPGPAMASVVTKDDIMKAQPHVYGPVWKTTTISLGRLIDSQRFMYCGDNSADGVSFTLYVFGTKDAGMIKASYRVEFAYPHPF